MRTKHPKLHDVIWLRAELEQKSARLVAQDIGCSYSGIVYAAKKYGIPIAFDVKKASRHRRGEDWSRIMKETYQRRYPNGRRYSEAGNWRGGRRKHPSGYFIYCPDHPFANKENAIAEHRLVMEKKLGRYLEKKEIVHHINGDCYDNRPENLVLVNRSQHVTEHFAGLKKWEIAKKHLSRMKAILNAPLERLEIMAE